jgi:hypothetical protein
MCAEVMSRIYRTSPLTLCIWTHIIYVDMYLEMNIDVYECIFINLECSYYYSDYFTLQFIDLFLGENLYD